MLNRFRSSIKPVNNGGKHESIPAAVEQAVVDLKKIDQGKTFVSNDVVFDLGVNDGSDSAYYLKKGFRVVGVEANPDLYAVAARKFAAEISSGTYTLLNVGLWHEKTILPFYKNLDNDHWSSFDPHYGCRNGTRYEVIDVQCFLIEELYATFGVPRYMKIDIEGADKFILKDLPKRLLKPTFVSVEEYGVEALFDLKKGGYTNFAILSQANKPWCYEYQNDQEGIHVDWQFNGTNTGIFGNDIRNKWMSFDEALNYFQTFIRGKDGKFVGTSGEWYDIHAR